VSLTIRYKRDNFMGGGGILLRIINKSRKGALSPGRTTPKERGHRVVEGVLGGVIP